MKFGVSTFLWVSPFDTQNFDLVDKIKGIGFDIIEVPVEIAKATCIWRPLANSSDELAEEGLAFYNKMFSEK